MTIPQQTTEQLLQKAYALQHMSVGELASQWQFSVPNDTRTSKGFVGQLLEIVLGTTSGNKPQPDFEHLGIELKTIPINPKGQPLESTFICSASLTLTLGQTWHESPVYQKLKKILWIPIITPNKTTPITDRKIGQAVLWQPSETQEQILQTDWEELMEMISLGQLANITAGHGTYLQLRPKAAHARILSNGIGESGEPILTLPRGYYLRASFTKKILK
ncbi:MAG: DNA mismatch repair endonuclease MutH [Legionellales bacterium]|jgi:DNA mismatch repair protein MutH